MVTPQDLVDQAESFAAVAGAQSGEQLDFSPSSLATVDSLLDQWLHLAEVYAGAEPPDLTPFVMPTAAYTGEVLRRALGGEWIIPEEPGSHPYLVLGGQLQVNAVHLVEQILRQRASLSLWETYQTLARVLSTGSTFGQATRQ